MMHRRRVVMVAGTRPEAIKLAPLLAELRRRPTLDPILVATGQHPAMLHDALSEFSLVADLDLAVPNPRPIAFCAALEAVLRRRLPALAPDLVLVQGDTNSAWVAARAAHALGLAVGHVEAGLRSARPDQPWPEERNRRDIDRLSTLLFAPSAEAAARLRDHGGHVALTGNTGIDAFLAMRRTLPPRVASDRRRRILVTCHRGEAVPRLPDLARTLRTLAARDDVRIDLPLHPNPALGGSLAALLDGCPRVRLLPPQPYRGMVALLERADLLLTDSGGLQEEAPALGLPTLVLRAVTERPEPIASGNACLVGLDPARVLAEASRLLDDPTAYAAMTRPSFPYGRGDAAARIADVVDDWMAGRLPERIAGRGGDAAGLDVLAA